MSAHAVEENRMTAAEYLAMERQAEQKHQFVDGQVFAMTGASRNHNRINIHLARWVVSALDGTPCEAFANDMRVLISEEGNYLYPDLVITCEKPKFQDDAFDTLLNPQVVMEILSESTEKYDRGRKFASYRALESLHTYVMISQNEPRVEMFRRQPDGAWLMSVMDGMDAEWHLPQPEVRIKLSDLYARVEFVKLEESESTPQDSQAD